MEHQRNHSRRQLLKVSGVLGLGATFGQGKIGKSFAESPSIPVSEDSSGRMPYGRFM
jgi:hypothetical protein